MMHIAAHRGELWIDARLLGKYGFTDGCSGCVQHQLGLGTRRAHSSLCRARIYDLMAADPEVLERMLATDQRLGRAQPREELTRRAKQDFPPDPQADETPPINRKPLGELLTLPKSWRKLAVQLSMSAEEEGRR